MTRIGLPHGVVYEISDGRRTVRTVFPDGSSCEGTAQFDDESEARARSLGYEGTREEIVVALTRDHDLLHHIVAQAEGWPWSLALHATAHGYELPRGVGQREERLVFLLTRALNLGGVLPEQLL